MNDDLEKFWEHWDYFNIKLYNRYKKETMKCYKITHRERDHAKVWRKVYSLRYGHTQDEAIKQLDRHPDLILKVEFIGFKINGKTDSRK